MGWLGDTCRKIGNFLFGSSGSSHRSSSSTIYEPDKVKIAQIEADNRERLARMEQDRLALWRDVQLDLIASQREADELRIQAQVKGFCAVAQAIITLQGEMNKQAQAHLVAIEQASTPVLKELEEFYAGLNERIENDNQKYLTEKLPKLFDLLGKYEEGSPQWLAFKNAVDLDMARQFESCKKQLADAEKGKNMAREAFFADRALIIENTSKITAGMLNKVELEIGKLQGNKGSVALPMSAPQLPSEDKPLALAEGKKDSSEAVSS